jgi:inositol-hexakisphosphate 5-kinase
MTSFYHHSNYAARPHSPPRSTDISPPNSPPPSLPKSPRPLYSERSISDPSPSEPPAHSSLSPNIHHLKSDVDRSPLDFSSVATIPFPPLSRPHIAPRESPLPSHAFHVIQSARPGLTFPTSPRRIPKPLSSRRSSSSRSTASSSDSSPPPSSHNRSPQHNSAGIGRKVADSLQLFKESVSLPATEVINPLAFSRACSPSRRRISTHSPADDDDDVIGPHFEFVKRSDWPVREAAALRREQCTLALDRTRTRESEPRRKDRADTPRDEVKRQDSRGRTRDRRQRVEQPNVAPSLSIQSTSCTPSYRDLCLTPLVTSHSYSSLLHSPPPSERISTPAPQFQPPARLAPPIILSPAPIPIHARAPEISHSRSPTPIRTVPELPSHLVYHDPVSTPSPWTTDDESAWESASVTSTSSVSSPTSPPEPLDSNPGVTWPTDDEYHDLSRHTPVDDDDDDDDDQYHTQLDSSEDILPHIPLRPFRNQVGGHASIYKFTKRAVCKVRILLLFFNTYLIFT